MIQSRQYHILAPRQGEVWRHDAPWKIRYQATRGPAMLEPPGDRRVVAQRVERRHLVPCISSQLTLSQAYFPGCLCKPLHCK